MVIANLTRCAPVKDSLEKVGATCFKASADGQLWPINHEWAYHRRMAMIQAVDPDPGVRAAMTAAACLFHGFSDPSRLAIVRRLAQGEHRVVDLTSHLGLAQSTVSKHLACLKDCGLVDSRPVGRASMWSLEHSAEVLDLLSAAERLLSLTGDAVTLCPRYGVDRLEEA